MVRARRLISVTSARVPKSAFADDDARARRLAASRSPSSRCCSVCGFFSSSSRPCASVMSAPARLPLSTVETYRGCNAARVDVSYQFRK